MCKRVLNGRVKVGSVTRLSAKGSYIEPSYLGCCFTDGEKKEEVNGSIHLRIKCWNDFGVLFIHDG